MQGLKQHIVGYCRSAYRRIPQPIRSLAPLLWVPVFAALGNWLFIERPSVLSFLGFSSFLLFLALIIMSRVLGFDTQAKRLYVETTASPSMSLPLYDLTESALIGVGLIVDGRLLWANRRLSQIFGYSLAQMLALESIDALVADSEKDRVLELLHGEDTMRAEAPFVFAGKNAEGEQLMVRAQAIWTEFSGSISRLIMVSDITAEEIAKHQLVQDQNSYRQVLDSLREAIIQTDKEGRLILISGAWEKITGYGPKECLYKRFDEFLQPSRRSRRMAQYQKILDGDGNFQRHREQFLIKNGESRWIELNPIPVTDKQGNIVGSTCTVDDITEVVSAERARQRSEHRFRSLIETMNDGLGILDADGKITYVNQKLADMLGMPISKILGHRVEHFLNPRDRAKVKLRLRHTKRISAGAYEIAWKKADETQFISITSFQPQFDDSGSYVGGFAVITDISDQKKEQGKLHKQARFDQLTGLANRASFEQRLSESIAEFQRKEQRFALLFLDLDGFKQVNDLYGHQFGDELLKVAAMRLQTCVRPEDMVARFGGDEFCILMHINKEDAEAASVAERIIKSIKEPVRKEGRLAQVSTSIGIALCDATETNAKDLIQGADAALYQAKEGGKACFVFYDRRLMQRDQRRAAFDEGLDQAIDNGELALVYQPVVDIHDGTLQGFEALLRWRHEEYGEISPQEFLGVAESSGKIFAVGRWALNHFAQQLEAWHAQGLIKPHYRFSLNLSAKEFLNPEFHQLVRHAIDKHSILSQHGVLEIPENAARGHHAEGLALANMGIGVCLDHFGGGMTQLAELNELKAESVKLSTRLTEKIDSRPQQQMLVSAVIELLHQLKVKVIATRLQSEAEVQALRDMGCDWGQGNFFAEPISAAKIEELLEGTEAVSDWLNQLGSV